MSREDDIYNKLFRDIDLGKTTIDSMSLRASVLLTSKQIEHTFILRTIVAVAARLSIIASVWVFIIRPDLWYGILLFSVLAAIFGGIGDRNPLSTKRHESDKK